MKKKILLLSILSCLSACGSGTEKTPLPLNGTLEILDKGGKLHESMKLGASHSILIDSHESFSKPAPVLNFEERTKFFSGESFFDQNWVTAPASTVARDGLGPYFNARSCAACHFKDGRGKPPEAGEQPEALLFRLSIPGKSSDNSPVPEPNYGGQFQGNALQGVPGEGKLSIEYENIEGIFADGEKYLLKKPVYNFSELAYGEFHSDVMISPRIASQMIGLGLLENISESDILAMADPDDQNKDGISGKANFVWNIKEKKKSLGRFGWKANQPTIEQQVAGAFAGDIGITSSLFPEAEFTAKQAEFVKELANGGNPEISDRNLERVVFYSQNLAVPARRNVEDKDVIAGEKLFKALNCQACHQTDQKAGQEIIHPYTDLLLHDMGEELADHRPDFEADGREWRTPPLWGIGLIHKVNGHTRLMHDGRADNIRDAVLWHDGEAKASKEKFLKLNKSERDQLIRFLNSI